VRELANHLGKLLLLGLFPCLDGGVGTEVEVFLDKALKANRFIRSEILVCDGLNAFGFCVADWAANSTHELSVADNTIVVLVEKLEHTFELTWAEDDSALLDAPLELFAVKRLVAVTVIFSEHL